MAWISHVCLVCLSAQGIMYSSFFSCKVAAQHVHLSVCRCILKMNFMHLHAFTSVYMRLHAFTCVHIAHAFTCIYMLLNVFTCFYKSSHAFTSF